MRIKVNKILCEVGFAGVGHILYITFVLSWIVVRARWEL